MTSLDTGMRGTHQIVALLVLSQIDIFYNCFATLMVFSDRSHAMQLRAFTRHAFICSPWIVLGMISWEVEALKSAQNRPAGRRFGKGVS
jgi:hypothetical protein